jgi:DHA3 family tetracycline resistance protein-like MFS transporter
MTGDACWPRETIFSAHGHRPRGAIIDARSSPGFAGAKILRPLSSRNYALLFFATAVSLLGDGIYIVAIAWEVYSLTNAPSALALVGVAATVPQLVFLLLGGALSDRVSRRSIMIGADGLRAIVLGLMAVLSYLGELRLWEVFVLVALAGLGTALFNPAYTAVLPSVAPRGYLTEANALLQATRPVAVRFAGPALGGLIVASLGTSFGFLIDAASFAASMIAVLWMHEPRMMVAAAQPAKSVLRDVAEGLRFVRSQLWLSSSLAASALGLLFYLGPVQVLMPFLLKNTLHGDARDLGLVFALGGVGAFSASLVVGHRGLPPLSRRFIVLYGLWAITVAAPIGYALATTVWVYAATSAVTIGAMTAGQVIWISSLQLAVPPALLGRVVSIDLLASNIFVPFSFALTAPVASALGASTTMLIMGVCGPLVILAFLPIAQSSLARARATQTDFLDDVAPEVGLAD